MHRPSRVLTGFLAAATLIACGGSISSAQPGMRALTSPLVEQIFDVRAYPDGGSILTGRRSATLTAPSNILVVRLDSSGDTVWQREIGTASDDDIGYCSTILSDGSIVVAATTSAGGVGTEIAVIRLSPAGGIVWSFAYRGSRNPADTGVSIRTDRVTQNLVVTGRVVLPGNVQRPVMFRLTSAGVLLWHRTYSHPQGLANYTSLNDLQTTDAGLIFATGQVILATPAPGDPSLWLLRTDAGGLPTFSYSFSQPVAEGPPTNENGTSIDVIESALALGGVIVAGPFVPSTVAAPNNFTVVMRTDPLGNPMWQRVVNRFTIAPVSLRVAFGNSFVMAGDDRDGNATTSSAILTSLDLAGAFKFRTRFTFRAPHELQGVDVGNTAAQGFLTAGAYQGPPAAQRDGWSIRTDFNGRTFCQDLFELDSPQPPSMLRTTLAITSELSTVRVQLQLPIVVPELENFDICPPPCPTRCSPADIAYDNGLPLPPFSPCGVGVNNGITEADYNLFFANFFDSNPVCDIANDDGSPLPPFGVLTTNNGVTEGDYNLFFSLFFDGC